MAKLILNKETIRNLDKDSLGKVYGGKYNTSMGRKCGVISYCGC